MIAGVALGAAAGLDRTAVGQTLLAHPFVAASLSAWWAGSPGEGLTAALILWMVSAPRVPVGEVRVRDWTTAAVVLPWCVPAGAGAAAWTLALIFSAGIAVVGGRAIEGLREIARRAIDHWRALSADARPPASRLHLGLTLLHGLRGAMLAAAAIVVGRTAIEAAIGVLTPSAALALERVWVLAPLGLLPLLWRAHGGWGRPRRQWVAMVAAAVVGGILVRGLA